MSTGCSIGSRPRSALLPTLCAMTEAPLDGLSTAEAAEILGATVQAVHHLTSRGHLERVPYQRRGLSREAVEALSLARWRAPGHPYWATTTEAAEVLGVTPRRVRQLVNRGFLPAVPHEGRVFFRRAQLEVVANAREARRWAALGSDA